MVSRGKRRRALDWVSGQPMQFAIAADQLATLNTPPLLLPSTTFPHLSSLRSQDIGPEPIRTRRPSQGLCSRRKFQSLLKLPGRGAHGLRCNVQLAEIFAQRPRKASNVPYKPQPLGYDLPLGNILGPRWGLGPWSTFHRDTNTRHSESTQHRVIWQRALAGRGEGRASF